MRSWLWLLVVGIAAGVVAGWHVGFEAGLYEAESMSWERGDCYCRSDCCEHE